MNKWLRIMKNYQKNKIICVARKYFLEIIIFDMIIYNLYLTIFIYNKINPKLF